MKDSYSQIQLTNEICKITSMDTSQQLLGGQASDLKINNYIKSIKYIKLRHCDGFVVSCVSYHFLTSKHVFPFNYMSV